MNFVNLILKNNLVEAKQSIFDRLNSIVHEKLEELKPVVATSVYEEVEILDEALPPSRNIVKVGRVQKIRRRIRRNSQGRIVVQRNKRRSAIKGYRLSGNTVKRIPAIQKIHKARALKRYWKTKGRSKMTRTLLKRKMSMRRRKSMGIR
jgi:hypothetical protein